MSINEAVKNYLEENPETNKPTFLKMIGDIFMSVKNSMKAGKKKEKDAGSDEEGIDVVKKGKKGGKKTAKADDGEEKPEKKLNAYQLFMKEQMPILQKRENDKAEGEAKKKPRELMSEISEMWKAKKG